MGRCMNARGILPEYEVAEGILQFEREKVMLQRNEVQRKFGDVSFSEYAMLFQDSVAD